jgi:CDP-glucose 4,6-dehydratase
METLVISPSFWRGRKVLLTGHTGFKGAWTALLLDRLGAKVTGLALEPTDEQGIFLAARVESAVHHTIGDIRELSTVSRGFEAAQPEIVLHMAAQSLVRRSYAEPIETYMVNVMGTANVLECARRSPSLRAAVIVTSDKCYQNVGEVSGYRESDPLGGHDPYSSSKACAEIVVDAYRRSFFAHGVGPAIATVRAGNVVGGGDWGADRLVPDAMRAFFAARTLRLRNPRAIRPWQYVLDPIVAYLLVAERLAESGRAFAEAWNFGPPADERISVAQLADAMIRLWGVGAGWAPDTGEHPAETAMLTLDCAKARTLLNWRPLFDLDDTLKFTVDWYRAAFDGRDMRAVTSRQLDEALARVR